MTTYPVNEVFETIQGEATWTGTPSLFVRLQGCPVGCAWCDTKYTWPLNRLRQVEAKSMIEKQAPAETWAQMAAEDVVSLARAGRPRHVVLTGGEPCLHNLEPLTRLLLSDGFTVQVETSGTHEVRVEPGAWVTVSPKFDMPGGFQVRADAVSRANEIKIPVGKRRDYTEAMAKLAAMPHVILSPERIWLQPLSTSEVATRHCIDLAMAHGHRVSVQVHKYLGVP